MTHTGFVPVSEQEKEQVRQAIEESGRHSFKAYQLDCEGLSKRRIAYICGRLDICEPWNENPSKHTTTWVKT